MSWPLKLRPEAEFADRKTGDCFMQIAKTDDEVIQANDWIFITLPGDSGFNFPYVDDGSTQQFCGWTVSGKLPLITISPSIKVIPAPGFKELPQCYHGYIVNGVILDDCDGKAFPA